MQLLTLAAQRERAVAPGVPATVHEREHVAAVALGLSVKRERPAYEPSVNGDARASSGADVCRRRSERTALAHGKRAAVR
jgi:hypothetical protein